MDKKKKASHSVFDNAVWELRALLKYSPAAFAIFLLQVPVEIGLQYLGIYLPALVVSEVTTQQSYWHAFLAVGAVLLAVLLGTMLKEALQYILSSALSIYSHKMGDKIRRKRLGMFFQTYENKEVRDLGDRAGLVVQTWNNRRPLTDIVKNLFGLATNLLGYLLFSTVISFASPVLVVILTVAPVVNFLVARAYNEWEHKHRKEMEALNKKLYFVQELPDDFTAAKDIRIYGMASWLREVFRELSASRASWDKKAVRQHFASQLTGLCVILVRDGGAYAMLIAMMLRGEIMVDEFLLYFAAVSSFADLVGGMMNCWSEIHADSLKVCDFRDYVDYPEEDGSGRAKPEEHLSAAPEIVFDDVSFRYDGAAEDTLRHLSFTFHCGEKLALVGTNGAGKTTLVKLLCGLYRPTSGEIRINGVPMSDFYRDDYYKLISPVFQDVRTAFFSIAETVSGRSFKDTDVGRVEECLRLAGLKEKLDLLPDGAATKLNKQVNKNGTELSGGEAQKLMLARALYKDAPLLVLDEPTAALDPIAESRIYRMYGEMCAGKTSLFISHRLASTAFCDRILLLKDGSIAEEGTHEELLRAGGDYRNLFEIQSCWYQEGEGV